ncbi:spore coat protein [Paenibacillus yanchengensis]|uniref:Spore coat protein n=1 Tax=Paenibacillus yanchengensis TaxID=2035833 RepID=A0ABW4YG78_9BACL
MQQQNVTSSQSKSVSPPMNHGGHELFDVHEVLSCAISVLDQYMMFKQHVQDQELMKLMDKQYQFMAMQYNITVDCFKSGQEPTQKTTTYLIDDVLQPVYGLQPGQPKMPIQSISEINDAGITDSMQGLIKSHAGLLTKAALETTNPVVRRVLAAQVQNFIEMSYELFMYQNKKAYYQVPQLTVADMQHMVQSYAPAANIAAGMSAGQNIH